MLRKSLISAFFGSLTDADQDLMLERLLATRKTKVLRPRVLKEVLVEMQGSSEAKLFDNLRETVENEEREEVIMSRFSAPRAKAEAKTPSVLKDLRPKISGCVLVYQVGTSTFQGYYPKKLGPEATKRPKAGSTYSAGRTVGDKWTSFQALTQVLNFLWNHHKKAGHAPQYNLRFDSAKGVCWLLHFVYVCFFGI